MRSSRGWVVPPALVAVLLLPPQGAYLFLAKAAAVMGAFGIVLVYGWRRSRRRGQLGAGKEPGRAQLEVAERDLG